LPIGVIVEINTRIDILIIGYYYSDSDIGLYSFVALLAEGLGQIPQLGKIYYDPRIAKLWSENRIESLSYLIFKSRFFWWSFMALICIFAYYFFIKLVIYIPNGIFYLNSAPIFAILLLSIFLSSGYIPFSGILQQTGYPERQSLHIISIFCINLMSNLIFVPVLGLFGSALGMLITQICLILLLRFFVKYTLKIVI
jgi:O-antigen/teichoic acid export membrane protein